MEYRDTAKEFLGKGWAFPVRVDPETGKICGVSSEEDIKEAVRIILLTGKGERMMQPDFGCNVRSHLFGDMDCTTRTEMEQELRDALVLWEPRIVDVEVQIERDNNDSSCLLIHISYVVRATNNPYNLVYPYYINEGLEG